MSGRDAINAEYRRVSKLYKNETGFWNGYKSALAFALTCLPKKQRPRALSPQTPEEGSGTK